ncbi:MAG: phosphatase PAP2 family protein [Candidatus Kapabacteria bacterium]|nr:phosphatase PAP2 family protein [Ignavibacteriota bacterium]MCW5885191.1 phosphatase PAP2 family protein [Candidatus Kapabacteria bacterium]
MNYPNEKANHHKPKFSDLIYDNSFFLISYSVFLLLGVILLSLIDKGDAVIFFNPYRGSSWDYFFILFSDIGEGLYFGLFLVILALLKIKYLVQGVVIYLGTGLVTQIFKNIFNIPRPKIFFEGTDLITYVPDIKLMAYNAFPSGHTTSGFAIFLFLAIITKNKQLGIIFLIMAVLVGISRIYLVQHFFIDVYFGSMVGVIFTLLIYHALDSSQKLNESKWYNYSIIQKFKTKQ